MNELPISNVNPDMADRSGRAVRPGEENQIAGLRFRLGNRRAAVINAGRSGTLDTHRTRLIEYPAHIT